MKEAKTRVTPGEKKLSDYCAQENETESTVILRQIRIVLNQEPHFTKEELKALRLATHQLTVIGRNLNQIAAKLNSGEITDSRLSKNNILKIEKYIDNQDKKIRQLIMPMFGLSELKPDAAKKRMIGIRRNLELRKNIVGLERTIANKLNQRPPGETTNKELRLILAIRLVSNTK